MDISFEILNVDRIKKREVTRFALFEIEVNKHREKIHTVIMDLNGMDMFLGYDWFVKHNPEVNWKIGMIWFTRCPKIYRTHYQNILFISKTRRI